MAPSSASNLISKNSKKNDRINFPALAGTDPQLQDEPRLLRWYFAQPAQEEELIQFQLLLRKKKKIFLHMFISLWQQHIVTSRTIKCSSIKKKKITLSECHLEGTEICLEAMANQNGVSTDEAQ